MNTIDPIQLQRLIDGELDFEQTRELIQEVQGDAEAWRLIASSFIENQLWESEFVDEDELLGGKFSAKKRHAPSTSGFSSVRGFALAAMVMLAASVSVLFVNSLDSDRTESPGIVNNVPDPGTGILPPMDQQLVQRNAKRSDLNQMPALYQVKLQDSNGDSVIDSEVPLYSGRRSEAERWLEQLDRSELARRAADSGYQVDRDIRYLKGQFKDGRNFLIPVRNYRFSPGQ